MCGSAKPNSRCFWCLEADGWRISTASLQGDWGAAVVMLVVVVKEEAVVTVAAAAAFSFHKPREEGLPAEPNSPTETPRIRFSHDASRLGVEKSKSRNRTHTHTHTQTRATMNRSSPRVIPWYRFYRSTTSTCTSSVRYVSTIRIRSCFIRDKLA